MSDEQRPNIHQEIGGDVSGTVVQAGHIDQLTINNAPSAKVTRANEIPASVRHYINYLPLLNAITGAARPETGGTGPHVVEIVGEPGSGRSEIGHQWTEQHKADFSCGTHLGLTVIFDAAYDRFTDDVKRVYRALGAHPGTHLAIGMDAVATALGMSIDDVDDALEHLRSASLVGRRGKGRYLLSTLVADHAGKAGGDRPAIRAAFIAHYRDHGLRRAETLKPNRGWEANITPLASQDEAQDWLVANEAAIVVAAHAAEAVRDHLSVVRLCLVTWPIYQRGGYTTRMVELNRLGADAAPALPEEKWRSLMLTQLAFAYRQQCNWDLAIGTLEQAETIGSPESRQSAVEAIGLVLREQGKTAAARRVLTRNLQLATEIADAYEGQDEANLKSLRRRVAMARFHLATVLEPDAAVPDLTSALDAFRSEPDNLAKIGLRLGRTLTERGDPDAAIPVLARAIEPARQAGATRELGLIHLELANADPANAEAHLRTALRILEFGFEVEADLVRTRMTELGY